MPRMSQPTDHDSTNPTRTDHKRQRTINDSVNAHAAAASTSDASSADADSAVSSSASAPRPSSVLFVGGLPTRLTGLRRLLKAALNEGEVAQLSEEPTEPTFTAAAASASASASAASSRPARSASSAAVRSVRVSVNSFNHPRSWASVSVRDATVAARLISRHHLRLRLPGTPASHPPLSVSLSAGLRLDSLFPFLPASLRPQMRMDPTAMFSITDQEFAQRTTQLILALTAVAIRDPHTPLHSTLKVTKGTRTAAAVDEAIARVKAAASVASSNADDDELKLAAESAEADDDGPDDDAMDGADDTPRSFAASAAPPSASVLAAAVVFSPDPEINRIVSEIADASWSTWTDLELAVNPDAPLPPLPALRLAHSPLSITDGCACSGGNALDFARHFRFTRAIELDAGRCADLRANAALLRLDSPALSLVHGDATEELFRTAADVVFMDPPWGGPQYKEILAAQSATAKAAREAAAAAAGDAQACCTLAPSSSVVASGVASGADLHFGSTSLTDLCLRLYSSDACRLLVLRVPFEYDCSALAARLTALPSDLVNECKAVGVTLDPFQWPRPHPFRLMQGKVYLLAIGFPSKEEKQRARERILGGKATEAADTIAASTAASSSASSSSSSIDAAAVPSPPASPPLHFCLSNLDSLVSVLSAYNALHLFECDPVFWDWEKERWISVRRWKGCTQKPAEKISSEQQQAALRQEGAHKKAGQLRTLTEAQQIKQKQKNEKRSQAKQNKINAKQDRKRERAQSESEQTAQGQADSERTEAGSAAASSSHAGADSALDMS